MLLGSLVFIAVMLTYVMFMARQAMLGFACAMFWAVLAGYAYTHFVTPWVDIYYYLFFAAFGMAIFTMIAAFGLREKREALADKEMDEEEGEEEPAYYDEEAESKKKVDALFDTGGEGAGASKRRKELRERAERRRTGEGRKSSRARG